MKAFYFLIPLLMINACKSTTGGTETTQTDSKETMAITESVCPEAGACDVKVMKNSSLTIKEDETGQLYPVIVPGDHIVIEYSYVEKGPEGTADGDYSETIQFEIANSDAELALKDGTLQEVNFLYGKHCFCRGEAGFYKVEKGALQLSKKGDELTVDASYVIDGISQKTNHFSKKISL